LSCLHGALRFWLWPGVVGDDLLRVSPRTLRGDEVMTRPQHGSRYPHGPRPGHWARRSDSLDRDGNAHGADDAEDTVEMDADRQRLAMGPLPDRVPRPPV